MSEITVRTDTNKRGSTDPFKEFKIVAFSGKEEDWLKWSKKFMAAARLKRFAGVIDGSIIVPEEREDLDEKDQAIRDLSQVAYCCLLYSMEEHISFNLVDTAKSDNLPDGDAALAWKNLLSRYEPRMYGTLMEWKKKFMTKSLEDSENDPEVLYLELERIRQRIQSISNECIKDEDMITQILNQMPDTYENKVDHIKHLIDTGKEPTLVEVVGHLREKFISLNKDSTLDSKATSNTKALIVKQFKGYCRECGEYGHKKANCPKSKRRTIEITRAARRVRRKIMLRI